MREPEPWEPEPKGWLQLMYGANGWVAEDSIQQEIGPEFLMYYDEQEWPSGEQQRFP